MKELSTQNPISKKASFTNEGELKTWSGEGILKELFTSRTTLKEQLKNSVHRNEMISKGILRHHKGRKNNVRKNMGKYNRFSFSRVLEMMFHGGSLNYNTDVKNIWKGKI